MILLHTNRRMALESSSGQRRRKVPEAAAGRDEESEAVSSYAPLTISVTNGGYVMKHSFYLVLMALLMTLLMIVAYMLMTRAYAEEEDTVWVVCNPESYVNIREQPRKTAHKAGFAYCGDDFRTDGKTKNGFIHVFAGTEMGDGWISKDFIVYCEPEKVDEVWQVESNGRVAVRSTVGGKRTMWVKPGDHIRVYYLADVAVTNLGFVSAEYLSPIR